MSISSEITRINGNIASAYTAVSGKGGTLPTARNSANLPAAIESIPSGGGVTVEPLSVTANGTYTAPTGKAYSPVTVNVSGGGGKDVSASHNVTVDTTGSKYGVFAYYTNAINPYDMSEEYINKSRKTFTIGNCWLCLRSQSAYGSYSIICDDYVDVGNIYSGLKGYLILSDAIITPHISCFLPDSLITLSDRTKKPIKDLTYDDELLVWDFDKGDFGTAPICWLTHSGLMNDHYYKLTFSDGTVLKTTGQNSNHKVYNVDERYFKGVDKTKIGDRIFSANGIVTVVNKEYIEEDVEYYNLITTHKINCFAEGILTSDRYGNLYPIDENMVYVKEGRKIRPYSEFEAVGIKRYWYDTLRLAEVSGTIEETQQYIAKLECQMLPLPEDNT